jgi:hypothetical protein
MVSTLLNLLGTWLACSAALGLFLGRVMAAQVEELPAPATRLLRHHPRHAA